MLRIAADHVDLELTEGSERKTGRLANDDVFVLVGGTPPFPLLQDAGVSFDPGKRPPPKDAAVRDNSLLVALSTALAGASLLLGFGLWRHDYYLLPAADRSTSAWHGLLRPQGAVGLWTGLLAAALFVANLTYLLRRSRLGSFLPGSLRAWMGAHVFTGLSSLALVCLHAGFQIRDSVGGHALTLLVIVVSTGAIGRWLYAFVPRAQNGRQSELEDLSTEVVALSAEWDRHGRGFGNDVREQVEALAAAQAWQKGFVRRVFALLLGQWRLRAMLHSLSVQARAAGVPKEEIGHMLGLARRAHRLALQLTHFDEMRGLLSSWRWLHRWLALLMVLLTVLHVITATRFGGLDFGVLWNGGGATR